MVALDQYAKEMPNGNSRCKPPLLSGLLIDGKILNFFARPMNGIVHTDFGTTRYRPQLALNALLKPDVRLS